MEKIIDVNYLLDPHLESYFQESPYHKVVFCDYACMEAYKGDALINFKKRLEIVSRYPEQVVVLTGTREIIKITQSSYVRRDLIDIGQTKGFRTFYRGVISAVNGESGIRNQILNHEHEAEGHFSKVLRDAEKVLEGIKGIEKTFTLEQLKKLRLASPLDNDLIERIIINVLLLTHFLFEDHPDISEQPSKLHVRDSYIFRYALAAQLLAIKWIAKGGVKDVKMEKLRNDVVDMGYIAYATLFDGLLTKDKKMHQIYDEAMHFLKTVFRTVPSTKGTRNNPS